MLPPCIKHYSQMPSQPGEEQGVGCCPTEPESTGEHRARQTQRQRDPTPLGQDEDRLPAGSSPGEEKGALGGMGGAVAH